MKGQPTSHAPGAIRHPVWTLPLAGTNLIEASAGTGKTWTISGLYLRLLLGRGLLPREILTVTFTNAATAELKARIRNRLLKVRAALAGVAEDDDVEHLLRTVSDRAALEARIGASLAGLEEAAIMTIHGFCQRVIADYAFELGLPFGMQVLEEEDQLLREAAADLWRREIAGAQGPWMAYVRSRAADPGALLEQLKCLRMAGAGRILRPPAVAVAGERAFVEAYRAARGLWNRDHGLAVEVFRASGSGKRHGERWAELIAGYFDPEMPGLEMPRTSSLDLFARVGELAGTPRGTPIRELSGAIARLCAAAQSTSGEFQSRYADLLVRCAAELDRAVQAKKLADAHLSYDDLIVRVRDGLEGSGGDRLAARLRADYKAALIDEFQDTDRNQYAIFAGLFSAAEQPLFLVGDPKQAIYAFRGADIQAYLDARDRAASRYDLLENHRSSGGLVGAINHTFGSHANPFLDRGIGFARVAARSSVALRWREGPRAPLQWWWLSGIEKLTKQEANERAVNWTQHEIARLLNDSARGRILLIQPDRPPRPLSGSDIAVLTGTHRESELIRAALNQRGIACTTQTMQSVLDTEQAHEMAVVVRAIARPGDARRLKAALATTLVGESAAGIAALDRDVARWDACVVEFDRYARLARTGRWLSAWQALLVTRKVAGRYLAESDGARKLTNLRHLAELVDSRMTHEGLTLESAGDLLLRGGFEAGTEERELRLESDEPLVRVMTMHGAKGLEFPIVFCPFLWSARALSRSRNRGGAALCHDEDGALLVDLGSPDLAAHAAREQAELMEESLRLAYVAMTRAQVRCYVACGLINRGEQSPLSWLLHGAGCEGPPGSALAALKARYVPAMAGALRDELYALAAGSGGTMEVAEGFAGDSTAMLPLGPPSPGPLDARRFTRKLWARPVASFSSMAAVAEDPERPDHDEYLHDRLMAMRDGTPDPGDAAFPRGARAGSCLHALFEQLLPSSVAGVARIEDAASLRGRIEAVLREHGIANEHCAAAFALVRNTLLTRLSPRVPPLAQIDEGHRLTELAFQTRIGAHRSLERVVGSYRRAAWGTENILPGPLALAPGYLKGYIDLVFQHEGRFYIVDYKSNTLPAYDAPQLERVVADELYDLQYLLYSSALVQYLRRRLPDYDHERCFGGVFYLFLRGMHPSTGFSKGIYFARPDRVFLDELADLTEGEPAL